MAAEDSLDFHIVPSAPQTVLEQDEAATSDTKDHHHKPFVELEMEGEAVPTEELPRKKRFGLWLNSAKHKTMALVYNLYHTYPTQYPHFSASPIWMMGSCYPAEPVTQSDQVSGEEMYYHPHFLDDFRSLLWFSYRRDFPCIEQSTLTTDTGWGCMLRTAQMMLSRVLLCKMLVLEHHTPVGSAYPLRSSLTHELKVLRLFADEPHAPFSVHNMVKRHLRLQKLSGEAQITDWFAPASIAIVLRQLLKAHCPTRLCMYIARDGVIYKDQVCALMHTSFASQNKVENIAASSSPNTTFPFPQSPPIPQSTQITPAPVIQNEAQLQPSAVSLPSPPNSPPIPAEMIRKEDPSSVPCFILAPVRLGISVVNEVYIDGLKALLRLPQSVGFLGGRPKQSLYFVGFQDEQLAFLDPHIVQQAIEASAAPETYHCQYPQLMPFKDIDPSLAIGFYCHSFEDFECLNAVLQEIQASKNCIISVEDVHPAYLDHDENDEEEQVLPEDEEVWSTIFGGS